MKEVTGASRGVITPRVGLFPQQARTNWLVKNGHALEGERSVGIDARRDLAPREKRVTIKAHPGQLRETRGNLQHRPQKGCGRLPPPARRLTRPCRPDSDGRRLSRPIGCDDNNACLLPGRNGIAGTLAAVGGPTGSFASRIRPNIGTKRTTPTHNQTSLFAFANSSAMRRAQDRST
jgi:hypothetical protein